MCERGHKRRKLLLTNGQGEDGPLKPPSIANTDEGGILVASSRGSFPVEILPPEVLELIFKNVDNPTDLLSCWYTTSAWASALRTFNFYFKMILPFVLEYLSRQDLLSISLVSKYWNQTLDACLQNVEDFQTNSTLKQEQRLVLRLKLKDIPDFLHRFPSSTSKESGKKLVWNPMPFRHVEIDLRAKHDQPKNLPPPEAADHNHGSLLWYLRKLKQFLDLHGHLIRQLHMWIDGCGVRFFCEMDFLRHCLKLTRDLRWLQISISYDSFEEEINEHEYVPMYHVDLMNKPWPTLKHLTVLKFAKDTYQDNFYRPAAAYSRQLVLFQFDSLILRRIEPFARRYSCLQKIVLILTESFWGSEFADFVQGSQCRLKNLTVVFCMRPDLDVNTIISLTTAANAVSTTLETLVFQTRADYIGSNREIDSFKQMRLPKLKVLELENFYYPSVEFLRGVCPALEQLIATPSVVPYIGLRGKKFFSDLYAQHQFWNELPNIQSVDVKHVFKLVLVDRFSEWKKCKTNDYGEIAGQLYTRSGYSTKLDQQRTIWSDNPSSTFKQRKNMAGAGKTNGNEQDTDTLNVLVTRSKKVYKRY